MSSPNLTRSQNVPISRRLHVLPAAAVLRRWFGSPPAPAVARPANLDEIHHRLFGRREGQGREPGAYRLHVAHRIAPDHDPVASLRRLDRGPVEYSGRGPLDAVGLPVVGVEIDQH